MARKCYVCGEPVSGFASRGFNKQLRRTVEMTERCQEAIRRIEAEVPHSKSADAEALLSPLRDLVKEGEFYTAFWHGNLHGYDTTPLSTARTIKADWVRWGAHTRRVTNDLRAPPEALREWIDAS